MPDLAELGPILIVTRVATRSQWEAALAEGKQAGGEVAGLLAAIRSLNSDPPHWWDNKPPAPPGLTDYQQAVIRSRFVDDELPFLGRDLALNQFVLLSKLGQGGQGEVYRARQLNPPRYAAVKTLVRDTDVRRRRFEQEARAMMKIQHPAVARFYLYERVRDSHGDPTDEYLIAMEFVNGTPLHRHVQRVGLVPWRFAVHWAIGLLGGLGVIHKNGFVHGDVKPENVMVLGPAPGPKVKLDTTAAKLLDFGAAKRLDGADEDGTPRKTFVGTPEYAPPEQWTGGEVAASDLYSLGGTLYYMLTARFPYQKERRDPLAYRDSHTKDPVLDVREFNATVPAELSEVMMRMMAKSPEDRGTAEELIAALRVLVPKDAPPKPKPTPAAAPTPAPRQPVKRPREEAIHNPIYGFADALLAKIEHAFIPGYNRPSPGEEAAIPDRLASLVRRPMVLVILVVFVGAILFGFTRLR